jgi:hypothetical protein
LTFLYLAVYLYYMARKKSNIHYIYKTTCIITGRWYIGMHSTCNLDDGYMGSGKRLRYSIRKYGVENHKKEIIEFFETRELLVEAEKKIITPMMLQDNNCMNLAEGGTGGNLCSLEQQKINLSKAREKQKELRVTDLDWNEKDRQRKSLAIKLAYKNGRKVHTLGFKDKLHSNETKQLMSEKAKERIGEKNSQYGTCWITNEKENKKINKNDLIPEGWRLGRKIKI